MIARSLLCLALACLLVQVAFAADASLRRSRHHLRANAAVANTRVFNRVMLGTQDVATDSVDKLPQLDGNANIQVYFVEAPLFKAKYGNAGAAFNLFHGGIGFCVGEEGACSQEFAVEYNAKNGVMSTLMPVSDKGEIKFNADNTPVWANEAEEVYLKGIDMTYWTKKTRVATINGDLYNKLRAEIIGDLKKFGQYKLFYVKGPNPGEVHAESSTCVDFAWRMLGFLAKNGVCLTKLATVPPRRDFVIMKNTGPKTILDAAASRQELATWFKKAYRTIENVKTQFQMVSKQADAAKMPSKKSLRLLSRALATAAKPDGTFFLFEDPTKVQRVKLAPTSDVLTLEYDHKTGSSYSPFNDDEKNCKDKPADKQ